jgi:hypothetical protein
VSKEIRRQVAVTVLVDVVARDGRSYQDAIADLLLQGPPPIWRTCGGKHSWTVSVRDSRRVEDRTEAVKPKRGAR